MTERTPAEIVTEARKYPLTSWVWRMPGWVVSSLLALCHDLEARAEAAERERDGYRLAWEGIVNTATEAMRLLREERDAAVRRLGAELDSRQPPGVD